MKNFKNNRRLNTIKAQAGFIKSIILVIVALVLIKYIFHINVIDLLTSGKIKDWLDKVRDIISQSWDKHGDLATKVWNYCSELGKKLLKLIERK